jgi:hypothetical protein
MAIQESTVKPQVTVIQSQVFARDEVISRPVVSFDASLGRRIRPGAAGGIAGLFHRLFGGRGD